MGNSISQSAKQSAHEEQPNTNSTTNTNRIPFSASLSSLSSFTNKFRFRSRRSYSLTTVDPVSSKSSAKTSNQVIKTYFHLKWKEMVFMTCKETNGKDALQS